MEPIDFLDLLVKSVVLLGGAYTLTTIARAGSASTRHLIWSVTFAGLLALPLFALVIPSWSILQQEEVKDQRAEASSNTWPERPANSSFSAIPLRQSPIDRVFQTRSKTRYDTQTNDSVQPAEVSVTSEALSYLSEKGREWGEWLVVAWITGAVLILGFIMTGVLTTFTRVRSASQVTGGRLLRIANEIGGDFNLSQPVKLWLGNPTHMPVTWGVQPRILLPTSAQDWSEELLRAVLLHELAHVKRRDYLTQMCALIGCAVYWFNPMAWYALRQLRVEQEHACDDMALNAGVKASDYAEHLMRIAASYRSPMIPASSMTMAHASPFPKRIQAILDPVRRRNRASQRIVTFTGAVAVILVLPLSSVSFGDALPELSPVNLRTLSEPQSVGLQSSSNPDVVPSPVAVSNVTVRPATPFVAFATTITAATTSAGSPDSAQHLSTVGPKTEDTTPACNWSGNNVWFTTQSSHDYHQFQLMAESCRLEVRVTGNLRFNEAETGLSVDSSGTLNIAEHSGSERRSASLRATDGEPIVRKFLVNGVETGDPEAESWFSQLIPTILRNTDIQVEDRAKRILNRDGLTALLAEIRLVRNENVARRYYAIALDLGQLDLDGLQQVVQQAASQLPAHILTELLTGERVGREQAVYDFAIAGSYGNSGDSYFRRLLSDQRQLEFGTRQYEQRVQFDRGAQVYFDQMEENVTRFRGELEIAWGSQKQSDHNANRAAAPSDWEDAGDRNRKLIGALDKGKSVESVIQKLGPATFREDYGEVVQILFYRTKTVRKDGYTDKSTETTPLLFVEGELIGWGDFDAQRVPTIRAGTNWKDQQESNSRYINDLEPGNAFDRILADLGPPAFEETIGDEARILYYRTHNNRLDWKTAKYDETTALIFVADELVASGAQRNLSEV